jgi:hypothetical protein
MRLLVAAAVALASMLPTGRQGFRVSVDAVRVDVLVTDGQRPMTGLTAADFELRDSGVVQKIDAVWVEQVPLSVMIALDASASVRGDALDHLKSAAHAVVDLLRAGDRAALLAFSEEVDLFSEWTGDRQQLHRAVAAARASGSTSLHDAAYAALTLGDPEAGRPLVLIFSDGDDTSSWLSGAHVLEAAQRTDAVVYGIGLQSASARRAGYLVDFRSGLQLPPPRALPWRSRGRSWPRSPGRQEASTSSRAARRISGRHSSKSCTSSAVGMCSATLPRASPPAAGTRCR